MFQADQYRPLLKTASKQKPFCRPSKAQQEAQDQLPSEPWRKNLDLVRKALFQQRDVPMGFYFPLHDFRKIYHKLDLENQR
jgi:hypothetical protein